MTRRVERERLDELSPDDPAAIRSRRDLQRLNRLMGHAGIMFKLLQSAGPARPQCLVELGAGDGRFLLSLARRLARVWPSVQVALVDLQPVVSRITVEEFTALGWRVEVVKADVFDWLRLPRAEPVDVMVANLFLHHFPDDALRDLLRLAAERARVFAACEPRRSLLALACSRLVGFIGCNAVTRHDAPASVRAGFAGLELSRLWPATTSRLTERRAGLFTHVFTAGSVNPS